MVALSNTAMHAVILGIIALFTGMAVWSYWADARRGKRYYGLMGVGTFGNFAAVFIFVLGVSVHGVWLVVLAWVVFILTTILGVWAEAKARRQQKGGDA